MKSIAILTGAYLLGSISFSYLLVRALKRKDVRELGSGNAGATNVLRVAGPAPAAAAFLLDLGKGTAAVVVARALAVPDPVVGAAAVAVVAGHAFSIFLELRGGKGVATSLGALLPLAPLPAMLAAALFVGMVAWKRYVSLGSVVAAGAFPFLVVVCGRLGWSPRPEPWLVGTAGSVAVLVLARHGSNLRRLGRGAEPRLGSSAGRGEQR